MRISRDHLGAGFEMWTAQRTWFWRLVDPRRDGGAIGAAATQAAAVREACISIEERFAHDLRGAAIELGWEGSLANLEQYLTGVRGAIASKNIESLTCGKSSTPATGR